MDASNRGSFKAEMHAREIRCAECKRGRDGHARNGECLDLRPPTWRPYGGLR